VQDSSLDPVAPNHVAELSMTTSNTERYIYFPLPSEVQLAVGETLRLSFRLRHTGTPRNDISATGASLAHTTNNSPWNNAANRDYFFLTSFGADGTLGVLRKTIGAQVLNSGTTTLATGRASINAGTNAITVSFEATRTDIGQMRLRYQLNNGSVQEAIDNTDVITAFNRVFIRLRARNDEANPGEPKFHLDDVKVEKIAAPAPPPTPMELWQTEHFTPEQLTDPALEPTLWGPNADPDGDGLPNLLEYALAGGNPLVTTAAISPTHGTTTVEEDNFLTIIITKNPDATDISYLVETSTDLATWQTGAGHTVVISDTTTELSVRAAAPMTNDTQRFLRLRVTENNP
jgi:hypothetical protein